MTEKWKLANILFDAKLALDSLWYISKHINEIYGVNRFIYDNRSKYYINCCAVMDRSIFSGNKNKDIKKSDGMINNIYTFKDKNYRLKIPFSSLEYEVYSLWDEILHVRDLCSAWLPNIFTLDFVCFDAILYRTLNKINIKDEEEIRKLKFPLYDNSKKVDYNIIRAVDDIRVENANERGKYKVLIEEGLVLGEGFQNRQKACILFNIANNGNMWCRVNSKRFDVDFTKRPVI